MNPASPAGGVLPSLAPGPHPSEAGSSAHGGAPSPGALSAPNLTSQGWSACSVFARRFSSSTLTLQFPLMDGSGAVSEFLRARVSLSSHLPACGRAAPGSLHHLQDQPVTTRAAWGSDSSVLAALRPLAPGSPRSGSSRPVSASGCSSLCLGACRRPREDRQHLPLNSALISLCASPATCFRRCPRSEKTLPTQLRFLARSRRVCLTKAMRRPASPLLLLTHHASQSGQRPTVVARPLPFQMSFGET